MNLTRWIVLLFILNLFFIGLIVGITFIKQNPITEFWDIFSDSSSNYSGLTPVNRFEVFLNRLQRASNQTVYNIYHRWSLNVNYLRVRISDTNIASFILEQYKPIVMDKPKASTVNVKTPAHGSDDNLANLKPTILTQFVNNKKIAKVPPSSTNGGRSDPFLTLGEKFQIEAKPKVKAELKTIPQPKIVAKEKVEPKLPIEPKVVEIPKLVKLEEKPGVKILNKFHLRGVVIGEAPIAYVEDQNGYHKLRIGDSLAEGKIIDISETSLTFQIDGEQVVMKMEGLK